MRTPGLFGDTALFTRVLGLAALLILAVVLAHRLASRFGGWAAVVRRLRSETALTVAAYVTPVRRWLRYRSQRRLLGAVLRRPDVWQDAERAIRHAYRTTAGRPGPGGHPPAQPYGALIEEDRVGVLVLGRDVPAPPVPWTADEEDPRLWWLSRPDAATLAQEQPGAPTVLLVGLGLADRRIALLDLAQGPARVSVDGDPRTATVLLQALAAQLDRRLPAGSVLVTEGVHPRYRGATAELASAVLTRREPGPRWAVCATDPSVDPPPDSNARLLVRGPGRGRVRMLTVDGAGWLTVHGTPLSVAVTALPAALARVLPHVPPYTPPAGPLEPVGEWRDTALGRSALHDPGSGSGSETLAGADTMHLAGLGVSAAAGTVPTDLLAATPQEAAARRANAAYSVSAGRGATDR
ncbi:hypothetical protein ACN27J_14110 [Solwaraspora sp. WMMB762]|uniref:hypothetical protein n=1 Tax=Solwaraspora sp. WMMB762 TaxID=3404120 RepID=UPI003B941AF7